MSARALAPGLLGDNSADLAQERRRENRMMLALTLPALIVAGVLMLVPVGWLFSLSFVGADGGLSVENYSRIWTDGAYVAIFVTTFKIALLVTALCVGLGYPVAYVMAILPERWSRLVMLLVLVPFWTSLLVRTYAWLVLLQRRGVVNTLLQDLGLISKPLMLVNNMTGTVIGMVHVMLPFLILPLFASLRSIDCNLTRAAANLGAGPTRAFFTVFLPLTMPGLVAGTMMVFVMCLGFYITPALLGGGKVNMIAQRIEQSVSLFPTWGPAAALAVVLLVLTAGFLGASWLIVRRLKVEV
ncbi:ABC transporter permease [Paracoccus aminophilus]|uniref:Spermidine/putrescine transport system, permease protein n=1 Tax=Paracoccus aminophilus JCM 7686 TaxID=1367847 RepID=S5XWU4_PARAH|nr:ABC transporter permease [Paracoccus aminophilus]AGT09782.1 spermidine/putrescine transport system, permease protein [Paracoccus aminophilus JCM 7686]